MKISKSELFYRRSAIEGASPIGLVIVLLDRLILDLRRAAAALHSGDIEGRCKQYSHAYLVLAQLQSWLDMDRATDPAKLVAAFYTQIRAKMMDAAVKKSAAILEKQIDSIVHVRCAWQLLDTPTPPPIDAAMRQIATPSMQAADSQPERVRFSQSA